MPLKYIDVTRKTQTSLDVLLEKNFDHHWNVDGERELSVARTGFTRFNFIERKATGWKNMLRGETDEKTNDLKTRQCMSRNVETNV